METLSIDYSIGERTYIDISVYDVLGQKVKTLVNKKQSAGNYKVNWDATDKIGKPLPSGIYFIKIKNGAERKVAKVIFMK